MALQAYPDVPLFRYPYTDLGQARIQAALAAPAEAGPGSKGAFDTALAGKVLDFVGDDGTKLKWTFGPGNRVTHDGKEAGYGALDLGRVTLIAHLIPGATRGYAIAWDRTDNRATVFELWFGGGPAPKAREVNRAVYFGYMAAPGEPPKERHRRTLRIEGRGLSWTEDTGHRTIDYYPSVAYTHWVELDRLHEGRGYSAPADYIQLTEDLYAFTRIEAEFSGLLHMYLMDANRLQQVGLRLGFNGADTLEYYMFRGNGEWLGQIARFEKFGETDADPLKVPNGKKGERRVYRPLATMDKMTPAEVGAVVAKGVHVFDKPSPMAGNGLPPTRSMAGKQFAIRYDHGPLMEYRFHGPDSLEWCINNGNWVPARYNAWESMPGVFIFGHLLEGTKNHDGHIVVVDLERGMATNYHGYLNTPYFANEAGCETLFGKVVGVGIPDPGSKRHERTHDMLGQTFTWEYSPGLNSMHLYSTPITTSWIIPAPDGSMGLEWCGTGDFVKIRDQLYFCRWQEEACNGTLGTLLINMRTMHDSGIGYHCGKQGGLSMSAVGAPARHAGQIDVARFFGGKT